MGLFDQNYMKPDNQARAVRAYLEGYDGVEASWNPTMRCYSPVLIAEWHNCREVGYVIMFRNSRLEQLNIAFFEHRNSDNICAVKWKQNTINPPTIETADFADIYQNKYDVSKTVSAGQAQEMAQWIMSQLEAHWEEAEALRVLEKDDGK